MVDDAGQHPRRPALVVDARGGDQLLEQPCLVVGIQDGEVRLQVDLARRAVETGIGFLRDDQLGVPPQKPHADRVERAEPRHALHDVTHHPAQPVAHLPRGLVGEGDGQHLVRPGFALRQQVRDPGRQRTGLAGARAGQHQHRPVEDQHRLQLRVVQPVEIRAGSGGRGAGGQARRRGDLAMLGHADKVGRRPWEGKRVFVLRSSLAISPRRIGHRATARVRTRGLSVRASAIGFRNGAAGGSVLLAPVLHEAAVLGVVDHRIAASVVAAELALGELLLRHVA